MRGQSDPDLTLLALAAYEAIRKSMKGENDEHKEKTEEVPAKI